MKLQMPSRTACTTPAPPATSRPRPARAHEHQSVLPAKHEQNYKSESDKVRRTHPIERDAEQASVIGETERPPPPSEKPEAS